MNEWKVYVCDPPKSGKNGRNFVLVAKENGVEWKRRSARTPIKAEAEQSGREFLAEILRTIAPLERDPTVAQVLERHMLMTNESHGIEDSTRVTYRTALRRMLPVMGEVRASGLDRAAVLDAVRALRSGRTPSGKPLKGTTLRLTLRRARDAWGWAMERGYVSRPWPKLKPRDVKFGRTKKRPYTDAEVVAVLGWIKDHRPTWHSFYALMAATGMRSSEVCGLRGRDVLRGEFEVRFLDAKSKEPTGAPVPAEVMALLPNAAHDAQVFVGPKGGRVDPHAANEVKLAAVRALGLPDAELLDVHSFKRSWVDALHRTGADMGTAMRAARHKSQPVHVGYQANATGHDVRAAQEKVMERRRRAAPLTAPLTGSADKSMPRKLLSGSPSYPGPGALVVVAHGDAPGAPHSTVASNRSASGSVGSRSSEGWDGIVDPHGQAVAEAIEAMSIETLAAFVFNDERLEVARNKVRERRPDLAPAKPKAAPTRKRGRRAR